MIETLHAILTDANSRDDSAVKAQLVDATSAGTPWANEA